jgi:outer membrane protein assembly factor BamD
MKNAQSAVKGWGLSILLLAMVCVGGSLISGCGSKQDPPVDMADILAGEALADYNHGNYYDALEAFQKIKDHYPFSQHSLLAELKIADCNYYLNKYDDARPQYEEFEQNHPTNEAIPYVLFQIGRSYFKMIDTIDRDPSGANNAIQAFSRLIKTYPDSPYTVEAQVKITAAKDFLARHELYVATFYKRTKEFKQAEGRLEYILDTYPESSVVDQARKMVGEVRGKIAEKEAEEKSK